MDAALDPKNPLGIKTPMDLVARVESEDEEAGKLMASALAAFAPRFVVNQVRDDGDVPIGHQLVAACARHLGVKAAYAGFIHYDDAVWRSVRRRRLFMVDAPTAPAADEIRRLAKSLLRGESLSLGW